MDDTPWDTGRCHPDFWVQLMGMVLLVVMGAGVLLGVLVDAVAVLVAAAAVAVNVPRRSAVLTTAAIVFALAGLGLIVLVAGLPLDTPRPGSDYDIAMKNLFLRAFGYCAAPGIAAILAVGATFLCPRKP